MRVLLIIILGSLCAWLAYDRSKLQEQLTAANSKLSEGGGSRQVAKNWLTERMEKRTDPLAKPPEITNRGVNSRSYGYRGYPGSMSLGSPY